MLVFSDYVAQAQSNLNFLQLINEFEHPHWDWHCTVAFYTALHLMNAHALSKAHRFFHAHRSLDKFINPYRALAPAKLPKVLYDNYLEMMNTSRKSRYLSDGGSDKARINVKHFMRQIELLDSIIIWFTQEYGVRITPIRIVHCTPKKLSGKLRYIVIEE